MKIPQFKLTINFTVIHIFDDGRHQMTQNDGIYLTADPSFLQKDYGYRLNQFKKFFHCVQEFIIIVKPRRRSDQRPHVE